MLFNLIILFVINRRLTYNLISLILIFHKIFVMIAFVMKLFLNLYGTNGKFSYVLENKLCNIQSLF